jgi:invasion protein IalB
MMFKELFIVSILVSHGTVRRITPIIKFLWGAVFSAFFASSVQAQGVMKGNFGEWEMRCDDAAQSALGAVPPKDTTPKQQCILYQNIADERDDKLNLVVVILKTSDPRTPTQRRPVLRVIAPLGILLPRGLALRIDQTEVGSTGFVRCLNNGCVAEVDMDEALIDRFNKGQTATLYVAFTPQEQRGLVLSLSGFDKGYAALQ